MCYFPTDYASYTIRDVSKNQKGAQLILTMQLPSPYPRNVHNVLVQFQYMSESVLNIKIVDYDRPRWEPSLLSEAMPSGSEPPMWSTSRTSRGVSENSANFEITLPSKGEPFNFKISRKSGELLMETAGGFTFSDQFLQLSSLLPSHLLYGLGEHRQGLMINASSWTTRTMWNRDHPPKEKANLYGSHPVYLSKDAGGWHGVFLHNSNAMDIVVQPAPAITWRPIGGIFHFYVMLGHSPAGVMAQYAQLVGTTFLPPFWALGFHLCWQNYGTAANTLATVERMRKLGIPQ
ncbi:lysosomal alpha-glucosidase-like, partial [Plakobranchus ocellatus]